MSIPALARAKRHQVAAVPTTGAGANGSGVISKLPLSIFDMSRMPLTTDNR